MKMWKYLLIVAWLALSWIGIGCTEDLNIDQKVYQCSSNDDCGSGYYCNLGVCLPESIQRDLVDQAEIDTSEFHEDSVNTVEDTVEDTIEDTIEDTVEDTVEDTIEDIEDTVEDTVEDTEDIQVCECSDGESCCDDLCINTESDPQHCGDCNTVCAEGESCEGGYCICHLPNGQISCGSSGFVCCDGSGCFDLNASPEHCGACNHACEETETCNDGVCTCPYAEDEGPCETGETCCEDLGCIDLNNDIENCGACGHQCNAGESCQNGACICEGSNRACESNETCCPGAGCLDLSIDDVDHCGGCNIQCETGEICEGGQCVCNLYGLAQNQPCEENQTCCPGLGCMNLSTSIMSCGGCYLNCDQGEVCISGTCECGPGNICQDDEVCCNGTCCDNGTICCQGECHLPEDPACGCGGGDPCAEGELCCDGQCVNPSGDVHNCGACGHDCGAQTGVCVNGVCQCAEGFGDCDPSVPGCETYLGSDANHCGSCANDCTSHAHVEDASCNQGECSYVCEDGYGDCLSGELGCETLLNTPRHCGSCNNDCTSDPNVSSASCIGGLCSYECDSGFGDCDTIPNNGCQDSLASDQNCGACGQACLDGSSCIGGSCLCPEPETYCSDRCVDLNTDVFNCGTCGHNCYEDPHVLPPSQRAEDQPPGPIVTSCISGVCNYACEPGYGDCVSTILGCETDLNTDQNCGACGRNCNDALNILDGICSDYQCDYICKFGYDDCDRVIPGCETDLSRDDHCGSCTHDCNEDLHVISGQCEDPIHGTCSYQCEEGWQDCYEGPGCETSDTVWCEQQEQQ